MQDLLTLLSGYFYSGDLIFPFYLTVALFFYFVFPGVIKRIKGVSLFDYILPKNIRTKKSFAVDVQWYLLAFTGIPRLISQTLLTLLYLRQIPMLFQYLSWYESDLSKALQDWLQSSGANGQVVLYVVAFVVFDLAAYLAHRISHSSNFLWQLHKAHYYSEQINYFAGARIHPLDSFFSFNFSVFFMAMAVGFLAPVDERIFSGSLGFAVDHWVYVAISVVPGYINRLNHSHFPIHFGRYLGKVLVSPANHAIHHSKLVINKNFGQFFSLWDVIFGTYVEEENINKYLVHYDNLGVEDMPDGTYNDVLEWVFLPVKDAFNYLKHKVFPAK